MASAMTRRKAHITKSRSGHYTVTVKEYGSWEKGGCRYPSVQTIFQQNKIDLPTARRLAAQYV
jgi:hypothetical protein